MSEKKVSVIVPVFNAECYLDECLKSIAGQTLENIEIICVDDGSTDNSRKILAQFEYRDDRFTVLTQANLNAGVARNTGMKMASGKYLMFLDSDDRFPHYWERCTLEANRIMLISASVKQIGLVRKTAEKICVMVF